VSDGTEMFWCDAAALDEKVPVRESNDERCADEYAAWRRGADLEPATGEDGDWASGQCTETAIEYRCPECGLLAELCYGATDAASCRDHPKARIESVGVRE
jgi:predicted RNA-binding Zn-ribbon protein involved in translation (DUF1610 family)